jgi:hypothetical protein
MALKFFHFLALMNPCLASSLVHLVISPIASEETVEKLNQLIYEHNFHFKSLYPDCPFTPKLHYLSHFADQIFNFGPGRNHWCTRLEAKHGFIKALPVNISSQINGTK